MINHLWLAVVDVTEIEDDWFAIRDAFLNVMIDSSSSRIILSSSFAYLCDHKIYPPDLFRMALDEDLCTCAINSEYGEVSWLDHADLRKWSRQRLQDLVEGEDTAMMLSAYGKGRGFSCDRAQIQSTLQSGNWPDHNAPMLQSASLLKAMATAAAIATQHPHANLVWMVDDGLEISYPNAVAVVSDQIGQIESEWEPPCDTSDILDLDLRLKWSKSWKPTGHLSPKLIRATIKPTKRNWNLIIGCLREAASEDGPAMANWLSPLIAHWPDLLRAPHKDVVKRLMGSLPLPSASLWRGTLSIDSKRALSSLDGLQFATGLTEISVWETSVFDLSPLKNLHQLEYISFPQTQVADLSPLKGLRSLRSITAWNSKVSDLTPLADLKTLEHLNFARTPTGDLSPIAGLPLLGITTGTNFNDFSQLAVFDKLEQLKSSLKGDPTPLASLVNLRELHLSFTDLDILSNFPKLERLNMMYSREVENFGMLANLGKLLELQLTATQFEDMNILSGLSSLKNLDLRETSVVDLTQICGLELLEVLKLTKTSVVSLAALAELSHLKELDLSYTSIGSLEPLAGLANLQRLNLSYIPVLSLKPLATLTNLKYLVLCSDQDLSPIEGLISSGLKLHCING